MMKRYLCRECGNVSKKDDGCDNCGEPMEKVEISRRIEGSIPFILAGAAAAFLIIGLLLDRFLLIWFTFPFAGAGLIYDHLYEKQVEEALKESI